MSVRILVQSVAAHLILIGHLPRPYFAAAAMGFGYAAWNVDFCMAMSRCWQVLRISFLYSQLFLCNLTQYATDDFFWYGAFMVCIGSILCWFSTRVKSST
jgi:hypothetical protein